MKKSPGDWYEIEISTTQGGAETAAAVIAELGYRSCEIRENDGGEALVVYHRAHDAGAAYEHAHGLAASISTWALGEPRIEHLPEQIWTESWKSHFPRLRVGRRLEILPPWEDVEAVEAGRVPIVIHPAMAFGTGHHETTHGCMQMLDEIVRGGEIVADIGCGTGVLAIAAVKLGATRAIAIDNDGQAVAAAIENTALNDVTDRVTVRLASGPPVSGNSDYPDGGFDIVVANIYAETLASMRDRLTSCVKSGGRLVLSGIEASRRSVIEDSFVDEIWSPGRIVEERNWLTFCIVRGDEGGQART
ncbi:MAG: 50S ribosomal protein L11 methyltransferase [Candidatus Binatia bacterium]